jgi:hypothetical protein
VIIGRGAATGLGEGLALCLALASALWLAGCSGGWSAEDRASFLNECLKLEISGEEVREAICDCARLRAEGKYDLAEIMGQDQSVKDDLVEIIQACSLRSGVRARVVPEG